LLAGAVIGSRAFLAVTAFGFSLTIFDLPPRPEWARVGWKGALRGREVNLLSSPRAGAARGFVTVLPTTGRSNGSSSPRRSCSLHLAGTHPLPGDGPQHSGPRRFGFGAAVFRPPACRFSLCVIRRGSCFGSPDGHLGQSRRKRPQRGNLFGCQSCLQCLVQPLAAQSLFPATAVPAQIGPAPGQLSGTIHLDPCGRGAHHPDQLAFAPRCPAGDAGAQRDMPPGRTSPAGVLLGGDGRTCLPGCA
jgi:hypothetical protein